MESIREEDRGTETMVFEMTSIQLNTVLQFCVGNVYEHKGKDRYNVYLVKNGRVHGCIGHYDVPLGDLTKDVSGTDFDVIKYQEPTWSIDASFHLLEKGKPEKEPEKGKEKPPPKPKSLFRVIITNDSGDCFYDSVVRSMPGNDLEAYDIEKVRALRKRVGEHITTTALKELLENYHNSVHFLSEEETLMKNDPYYAKYYKMLAEGVEKETVIAAISDELAAKPKLQGKLDVETFRVAGPEDPSENKFDGDAKELARHFLHDYFNDEMKLIDADIPEVFLENIEKDNLWADEFVIAETEKLEDIKFLFLKREASPIVEEYGIDGLVTYKAVGPNTKFVIVDYTPLRHFKLIVHGDKKQFTIDQVPAVIKAKFTIFQDQPAPAVAAAQDADLDELETPAVELPEADSPDSGVKYTRDKLEKMSNKQLEDILKFEFDGVPVSTLKGKPELIECILNPEQEKCKKKKTKRASLAPVAPSPPVSPAAVSVDEDSAPAASVAPTQTYTRDQLNAMSKKKLEEILKTYPNVSWTTVGKKGIDELIDCILDPNQEKCLSKKVKKKGGNYTRRHFRQQG
jgi:hypothetical protein